MEKVHFQTGAAMDAAVILEFEKTTIAHFQSKLAMNHRPYMYVYNMKDLKDEHGHK